MTLLTQDRWHRRFLALAEHVAEWSKDRSTRVGAVVVESSNRRRVLSLGYNGLPRGVSDDPDERHDRPEKYLWAEHAERNAIYNASESLVGATLYSTLFPCAGCARAIVQSGIRFLVAPEIDEVEYARWREEFRVARTMFEEAGVSVRLLQP